MQTDRAEPTIEILMSPLTESDPNMLSVGQGLLGSPCHSLVFTSPAHIRQRPYDNLAQLLLSQDGKNKEHSCHKPQTNVSSARSLVVTQVAQVSFHNDEQMFLSPNCAGNRRGTDSL